MEKPKTPDKYIVIKLADGSTSYYSSILKIQNALHIAWTVVRDMIDLGCDYNGYVVDEII